MNPSNNQSSAAILAASRAHDHQGASGGQRQGEQTQRVFHGSNPSHVIGGMQAG